MSEQWHSTYSHHNPEFRKLAIVVLSKSIGAGGAPERNWADVKTVWDSTSAKMRPEKVEKKVIIYDAAHRLKSLTGVPDDVHMVWEAKDEVWDNLGLGHFNQVGVATLAASVRQKKGDFLNFIDPDNCDLIMDSGRVAEARLVKKYKGICFFDDDEGEGGYFRIRSDRFTWRGKKGGGWVIVCDKMPDEDPAHDHAKDAEIEEDGDLVEYVINKTLHEIITAGRQAPDIILVEE